MAACSRRPPPIALVLSGRTRRRSRLARSVGLPQRRAGDRARTPVRAVDHRPRKAARREPRRGAAQGLQAQARRRRLHARHRHALPGRAHHRADAGRALHRAACACHSAVPDNGDPIPWRGRRRTRLLARLRRGAACAIVDPACGSGAFLVAAFDLLAAEYRRVVEHLARLASRSTSIRSTRS